MHIDAGWISAGCTVFALLITILATAVRATVVLGFKDQEIRSNAQSERLVRIESKLEALPGLQAAVITLQSDVQVIREDRVRDDGRLGVLESGPRKTSPIPRQWNRRLKGATAP
jgi:hypothetical protein